SRDRATSAQALNLPWLPSNLSSCRDYRSLRRFSDGVMNGCNFYALFLDGCGKFGGAAEAPQSSGTRNPSADRRVGSHAPDTGCNALLEVGGPVAPPDRDPRPL